MTVTFGVDVSHHQRNFDFQRCRAEGHHFAIIKATEGTGFVSPTFRSYLDSARRAGLIVAAYHYQRAGSAQAQVDLIRRTVPVDVPVILDVEDGSGDVALTRDILNRLRAAGYRSPVLYLPRWYWQRIGSPSLAGLPPLWSSRYPDNVVGTVADEWADVTARFWDGYGGLPVALLQFTSSAIVANSDRTDVNAFRGTRDELAALLRGEDDMPNAEEVAAAVWRHPQTNRWGDTFPIGEIVVSMDRNVVDRGDGTLSRVDALAAKVDDVAAEFAKLRDAVAALNPDTIRQTIREAVAEHVQITGTVQISTEAAKTE